jgi:hypothetical protein
MKTAPLIKITKIKANLVGKQVPTTHNGAAGRYIEDLMMEQGFKINQGAGPDLDFGPGNQIEMKSRDEDATSPHTVCNVSFQEILNSSYENSPVYKKIQKQFRVKIKDEVIVSQQTYDLSSDWIQDLIKDAWTACQKNAIAGLTTKCTIPGTQFGYIEIIHNEQTNSTIYRFRLSNGAMKKIESISNSTVNDLFDLV